MNGNYKTAIAVFVVLHFGQCAFARNAVFAVLKCEGFWKSLDLAGIQRGLSSAVGG